MSLALRYSSVQQTVKCEVSGRREVHARSFWGAADSTRPLFGEAGDELLVPASRHLQCTWRGCPLFGSDRHNPGSSFEEFFAVHESALFV